MSAKLDSYLFTVPSLGLPVLGVILLILVLINAASNLLGIFTINGKKETGVNLVIGDD
jgi:hypothetical protein